MASRIVAVLFTLAQVPLALRVFGPEAFGVWMTVTYAASVLALGDLGLGLAARTAIAATYTQNPALARALFACAIRRSTGYAVVVVLAGVVAARTVDWAEVLQVRSPELQSQLPLAMTILAVSAGFAIPAAMGAALATALGHTWLLHATVASGSIATFAVVALARWLGLPWLGAVTLNLAIPIVTHAAIGLWAAHRHFSDVRPALAPPDTQSELTRLSGWFFANQAGATFMTMGVPLVLAAVAGPLPVAAFNLLQRIFGLVGQTHWMALSALWPAYSEAKARGDATWIRATYRQSWNVTAFLFVPAMILLAFACPALIENWVQEPPPIATLLVAAVAAWFSLQLLGQPPALLLNGFGTIRRATVFAFAGHLVSLAAMLAGGRLSGSTGVVVGMIAGYACITLPLTIFEAHRALRTLDPA